MRTLTKASLAGAIFLGMLGAAGYGVAPAAAAEKMVTIGTAGVTGVYYPAGGAICRLVNRGRKEHGVRCGVESTGGSISNLDGIRSGELEMAVVQSNLLYDAYHGGGLFYDDGANARLRVLFSLHAEPFTVVTRKDSGIARFDDLKGKKVNLGNPGSGMRATVEELMDRKGWTKRTFASIVELKSNEQAQALCDKRIDAMIYAGGHPNGAIQQVTSTCPTTIIDVTGPAMDKLIAEHPFYAHAVIPSGMYIGNQKDINTFGVKAVLVTSSEMSDDTAYQIVKAVFDNLDNFKTLHPVFSALDAKRMVSDSAGNAPIHPGALKYFKEKGWVD